LFPINQSLIRDVRWHYKNNSFTSGRLKIISLHDQAGVPTEAWSNYAHILRDATYLNRLDIFSLVSIARLLGKAVDKTTSHCVRLLKDDNQTAGYICAPV